MVSTTRRFAGARLVAALLLLAALGDVAFAVVADAHDVDLRWWTATGLVVAATACVPPRWWVAVAPAAFVIGGLPPLLVGGTLDESVLALGLACAAQALLGAAVLGVGEASTATSTLNGPAGLTRLLGAAAASAVVAVVVGGLAAPRVGLDLDTVVALLAHAGSVLVWCPLVLVLRRDRTLTRTPETWAHAALVLVLAGVQVLLPQTPLPALALVVVLGWGAAHVGLPLLTAEIAGATSILALLLAQDRWATDAATAATLQGSAVLAVLAVLGLGLTTSHRDRLLAENRRWQLRLERSPVGVLLLRVDDARPTVAEVNPSARRILGVGDDAVGRRLEDLVTLTDPLPDLAHPSPDEPTWRVEGSATHRPGSHVQLALFPLDVDGTPTWSAQLIDVTTDRDTRRRLEVADKLTDATLETTACIIAVIDAAGTVIRVNAAATEITGYPTAELVGRPLWDTALSPLDRGETEAMFVWPNRSGYPVVRERAGHTRDGRPLRLVWNNNVVRDEHGQLSYAVLTGMDVTSERATASLMTQLLQSSIATALIGIDTRGRITVFNAGAQHLLGFTAEEMVGSAFVDLLDDDELARHTGATGPHQSFTTLLGTIGEHGESAPGDWSWRTRLGHRLIVSMTLSVTDEGVSDQIGFLCVARDVTEQREAQRTLMAALDRERTAVERLRSLDSAKDEFVSTVSHELRTPVTSILGYTEMLLDGSVGEVDAGHRRLLDIIARSGERLISICNDLLALSSFDSGVEQPPHVRFDLGDVVRQCQDAVGPTVAGRQLTVRFEVPGRPVPVSGDRAQIDRVVANLVSNAIKFTGQGGEVTVRLDARASGAVLQVRDTGIGIAADELEAVFQRFYRTAPAQTRAIPGTGLGLAIVADIVRLHDGTITVESEPDVGSTFEVRLPLAEPVLLVAADRS